MRALFLALALVVPAFAQDRMIEALRKGIVAEDANHNFGAAIQQYEAVLAQFNDARQTAATALFRIAECYRKQGNRPQAIAAYQRVVREFGDQPKLADPSRETLKATYQISSGSSTSELSADDRAEIARNQAARARYRHTIEQEMDIVRRQLETAKKYVRDGVGGMGYEQSIDALSVRLLQLEGDLAALDAGMPMTPRSRQLE